MNSEKQQFFRNLLGHKIAELSGDQTRTLTALVRSNERFTDILDQTSSEVDRNFELRIRDRERKLIEKMREAIQRIDAGTYGICDDCGEEISEKRLIARPVTTLCIDCKTEQEKIEKLKRQFGSASPEYTFRELSPFQQEDLP